MQTIAQKLLSRTIYMTLYIMVIGLSALLFMSGCAMTGQKLGTRFFPPAPEAPKIQFLKRISSSRDIEKHSAFETFVVGGVSVRRFGKPYGVDVHNGIIYVCDVQFGTVMVIDIANKKFDWLHDQGAGDLIRPINIAFDKNGTKYVADYERHQVVVFDSDNNFKRAFGNKEQFKPTDVAVFEDKLYVADSRDHEIEVLDKKTGETLSIIGDPGQGEGQFYHPTNLTVDKDGNLYVSDTLNCRVQKFDPDGNFLLAIGQCGDAVGTFARPKGVAVDDNGFIYVVDSAFENVQIFTPEGEAALFFGGWGDAMVPGALWLPAGVTTDKSLLSYFNSLSHDDFILEHLVLVTSQYGPPYINIYGFGNAREGSPLAKGEIDTNKEYGKKHGSGAPKALR